MDKRNFKEREACNVYGVGSITTWEEMRHSCIRMSGVILLDDNVLLNIRDTFNPNGGSHFAWVIYLLSGDSHNIEMKYGRRETINSSNLYNYPKKVGISLIKVRSFENNKIVFDGLQFCNLTEAKVLEIVPYLSEYHAVDNFRNKYETEEDNVLNTIDSTEQNYISIKEDSVDYEDNHLSESGDFDLELANSSQSPQNFDSKDEVVKNETCVEQPITDHNKQKKKRKRKTSHELDVLVETYYKIVGQDSDEVMKYQCLACLKIFTTKNRTWLRSHVKLHQGKKHSQNYRCNMCPEIFSKRSDVVKHNIHVHSTYNCKTCKESFSGLEEFQKHRLTHFDKKLFQCDVCKKCFLSRPGLANHKIGHSDEKRHQCSFCGKRFARKSTLNMHNLRHIGEKPFKCTLCSYSCAGKGDLIIHMRSHTGEKPYMCDVCGSGCSTKSNLIIHVRAHYNDRQFTCKVCQKTFVRGHHLKKHSFVHTGEKPHACPLCEKAYVAREKLKKHFRTNHPDSGELPSLKRKW